MYLPEHFHPPSAAALAELLRSAGASDLVVVGEGGLTCSTLPFVYEADAGPAGALLGHLARANTQWQSQPSAEVLVIVRGPDAYVSPSWYPSKAEDGRVVPTWNYIVAHVYGWLVVHDDRDWTETLVRRLTEQHEASRAEPWSVDDAPSEFIANQLRAIVGIEVEISRIEGKWKLSQNRSADDVAGVVTGLENSGGALAREVARAMHEVESQRHARP